MKKLLLFAGLCCLQLGLNAATPAHLNNSNVSTVTAKERAKAHFKANFSNATDDSWFTLPDNGLYCVFHEGKTIERVYYDNHGYWRYTMLSYPVERLDQDLVDQVLNEYPSYQITYVNEVLSNYEEPVYMVNIENSGNIKVIKLIRGGIQVCQNLKKG